MLRVATHKDGVDDNPTRPFQRDVAHTIVTDGKGNFAVASVGDFNDHSGLIDGSDPLVIATLQMFRDDRNELYRRTLRDASRLLRLIRKVRGLALL